MATGGLEPDLTLVFDAPLDVILARRNPCPDRLEERDREYQQAVKRGFLFEAGRRPDKHRIIDAAPDPDTVWIAVRREVTRLLASHGWTLEPGATS